MNRHINTRATIAFLTTFGILVGCATQGKDLVGTDTVKIHKVSSAWGTIGFVRVIQDGEEVTLRGAVKRRPSGRGFIPGHIELEVNNPEGDVLEQCVIDYYPGPKSTYANFHAVLNATPPPGSTIRVIHDSHVVSAGEQGHCSGSL
jgi:hypothetical protein